MSIARRFIVVSLLLTSLSPAFVSGFVADPAHPAAQDDEDAAYHEAMIRRSLEENCLICHTEDIIGGQRLTPAQWKAEVEDGGLGRAAPRGGGRAAGRLSGATILRPRAAAGPGSIDVEGSRLAGDR